MNKKNIDKLFQEKLKDFHETPDERVWKSIEHSLNQRKKSRRVIPLWWKLGGAAAVLLIGLLVFNPFGSQELQDPAITDTEQLDSPITTEDEEVPIIDPSEQLERDTEVVNIPEDPTFSGEEKKSGSSAEGQVQVTDIEEKNIELERKSATENDQAERMGVADQDLELNDDQKRPQEKQLMPQKDRVVAEVKEAPDANTKDPIKEDRAVVEQEPEKTVVPERSTEAERFATKDTEVAVEEELEETKDETLGKKSIFDEINKQQEDDALAENDSPKWSVGPSVAPVYFNSFGEGSPIHSNFVSNSKSGNVNFSYGLAVSYELSDKLSVRSGIHKVDYGYDTNDITFSSSLVASTSTVITNIDYTSTSRNLVVESSSTPETVQEVVANDIIAQNPSRSGRMVQEFGYIEVPMELNYSLMDRKLNIDLIGGVSSLFLVNNSVILESAGTSTEMGEANNINEVNFSTNVGLGINYELTDKMKVHLEPMFKYQLNTFSGVDGNFQPYSLGVYTGMSFRF